jgi:hypothetical protein
MYNHQKNTDYAVSIETPAANGRGSSRLLMTYLVGQMEVASETVFVTHMILANAIATCASGIKENLIARGNESSRVHTQGKTDYLSGMPISPVRISNTRSK